MEIDKTTGAGLSGITLTRLEDCPEVRPEARTVCVRSAKSKGCGSAVRTRAKLTAPTNNPEDRELSAHAAALQ